MPCLPSTCHSHRQSQKQSHPPFWAPFCHLLMSWNISMRDSSRHSVMWQQRNETRDLNLITFFQSRHNNFWLRSTPSRASSTVAGMIRPFICLETLGISMNTDWLKWKGEKWEGRRLGDSYDKNVREYSKKCRPREASLRFEESRISQLLLPLPPQLLHGFLALSSCRSWESCPSSAEIILRKKMQGGVNTRYFEKGSLTFGSRGGCHIVEMGDKKYREAVLRTKIEKCNFLTSNNSFISTVPWYTLNPTSFSFFASSSSFCNLALSFSCIDTEKN